MPDTLPTDSVGIVESKSIHFEQPLQLECGKTLPEYDIAYETYGELNGSGSNAVLICHELSGAGTYHLPVR
jgi:homoserine O-acetyltransferase